MYNLPFTIKEISSLVDYTWRRDTGNGMYIYCPVCDKARKGKLHVHFANNYFHCNRCGYSGGTLEFYRIFGNAAMTNNEITLAVSKRLRLGEDGKDDNHTKSRPAQQSQSGKIPLSPLANNHMLDAAYRELLNLLSLENHHKKHLVEERKLSDQQIILLNLKSVPTHGNRFYIKELSKKNIKIQGVPGFYVNKYGFWDMLFNERLSGIIIPVMGLDGLIRGLQIRLDKPFENNTKYIWFSTTTKPYGCSCGSPPVFMGKAGDKTMTLVEGGFKAMIVHCVSGKTVIGNQGANNLTKLRSLLIYMKKRGTTHIELAYDLDKYTKIAVNKGYVNVNLLLEELEFEVRRLKWNDAFNGYDEFLLYQRDLKTSQMANNIFGA